MTYFWRNACIVILFLCTCFLSVNAQKAMVKGQILDNKSGLSLIGVSIIVKNSNLGTTTDDNGLFSLELSPGNYQLLFRYSGYKESEKSISLEENEKSELNIRLDEDVKELELVTVTGTKYERKVTEQVVSIEVLKLDVIQNSNSKVTEALNKVPGVNMIGGNVSIRGGQGFSDGANSRVLLLLDDVPLIGAENGTIKWEALPLESVEQMEVIKGASSAVYGTSAMNGVINIRTGNPKGEKPYTKFVSNIGYYQKPPVKNYAGWWSRDRHSPVFGGINFVHRRKFKAVDFSMGGNYTQDQSYLKANDQKRFRINSKIRRVFTGKKEGLSIGLNVNFSHENGYTFFAWKNYDLKYTSPGVTPVSVLTYDDSSIYIPRVEERIQIRNVIVDPYLIYFNKSGDKFSVKFRYFNNKFENFREMYNQTNQYYGEFNYTRLFKKSEISLSTGASGFYATINSTTFNGKHTTANAGVFLQAEKKFFNKLLLTAGARLEFMKTDTLIAKKNISFSEKNPMMSPVVPVFRVGANFQASRATFIRASFGQGYRFPTSGELFVYTSKGGAQVYPNPYLVPESGWSTELGIKQAVKLKEWFAYFDVSGFYSEYRDMIDYRLGTYYDPIDSVLGFGAQAQNISQAVIFGTEASAYGQGKIFGVPFNFIVGYSYLLPYERDTLRAGIERKGSLSKAVSDKSVPILPYRNRHNVKADIEATYKGVSLGISFVYTSFVDYVDPQSYGVAPGLFQYRNTHRKGNFVFDIRSSYTFLKDHAKVGIIVKNLLNREYMLRAGMLEPPRNLALQWSYQF